MVVDLSLQTASVEQVCFSRPSGIVLVAVAVAGRLLLLGHFRDCGIDGGDGGKDPFFGACADQAAAAAFSPDQIWRREQERLFAADRAILFALPALPRRRREMRKRKTPHFGCDSLASPAHSLGHFLLLILLLIMHPLNCCYSDYIVCSTSTNCCPKLAVGRWIFGTWY